MWARSVGEKLGLAVSEPDTFVTTSHYDGHPILLGRLESVDRAERASVGTREAPAEQERLWRYCRTAIGF